MDEYNKLTEEQKEKVKELISDLIDSIYDERKAYGTCIEEWSSGPEIVDNDKIRDEWIESIFVGYYCNECNAMITKDDDELIKHILKHLEDDEE